MKQRYGDEQIICSARHCLGTRFHRRLAAALCRLVRIRWALGYRHAIRLIAAAKDAAPVVVMVQLRAAYRAGPLQPAVERGG